MSQRRKSLGLLLFSLLIFAFPAHLCRDFLLLFGKRGSAAQGRWRSRLSRVGSCKQKEKTLRKKPQCLLAQKERLDRALRCLFAARTIPFYVPFCCAKRWTIAFSSLPGGKLQTKRKDTKEKTSVSFGAEGETRQGAALSVRCANDPILCPFLLRKKMDDSVLVSPRWEVANKKKRH